MKRIECVPTREATRDDWIYFAGFFDGEGCIRAPLNRRRPAGSIELGVANTNFAVIYWIKELFGGRLEVMKRYQPHHQPALRIKWSNAMDAKRVLTGLLPFLRVKRDQAEIGLALCESIIPMIGTGNTGLPKAEVDKRMALRERLRLLKGRIPKKAAGTVPVAQQA